MSVGAARRPKNIVLLSDGTGNSAASPQKTNVWRVYQALDLTRDDQVAMYDAGVGTASFRPMQVLGQALGIGLAENVRDLYGFLSRNYRPGDRIFAFGFSRGAFTIRTVMGLVLDQGLVPWDLPEADFRAQVHASYRAFRRQFRTNWTKWFSTTPSVTGSLDHAPDARLRPDVEFLGLWDTVDAYGMPLDEVKSFIDQWVFPLSFPDQQLSPKVRTAWHALSVDDERHTFHPVLWDERTEAPGVKERAGSLVQVWFPGVHANVGGGYPMDGLAYLSLQWMLSAPPVQQSLVLHRANLDECARQVAVFDELYDPRAGLGAYYRYGPRDLTRLCNDPRTKVLIPRPKIHESVFKRVTQHHVAYAPIGLPADYDLVRMDGTILTREDDEACATPEAAVPAAFVETIEQAQARAAQMDAVWDLVSRRRLAYYGIVLSTLAVAGLPWLAPLLPATPVTLGRVDLSHAVSQVMALAPAWLPEVWTAAARQYPLTLLLLVVVLGAALQVNSRLRNAIMLQALDVWRDTPPERLLMPICLPESAEAMANPEAEPPMEEGWAAAAPPPDEAPAAAAAPAPAPAAATRAAAPAPAAATSAAASAPSGAAEPPTAATTRRAGRDGLHDFVSHTLAPAAILVGVVAWAAWALWSALR